MNSSGPPDDVEEEEFPEESIGTIVEQVDTPEGTTFNAEIVQVFCPACGEQFVGTKRGAGGFIAGHRAYHEFENTADLRANQMGGA